MRGSNEPVLRVGDEGDLVIGLTGRGFEAGGFGKDGEEDVFLIPLLLDRVPSGEDEGEGESSLLILPPSSFTLLLERLPCSLSESESESSLKLPGLEFGGGGIFKNPEMMAVKLVSDTIDDSLLCEVSFFETSKSARGVRERRYIAVRVCLFSFREKNTSSIRACSSSFTDWIKRPMLSSGKFL